MKTLIRFFLLLALSNNLYAQSGFINNANVKIMPEVFVITDGNMSYTNNLDAVTTINGAMKVSGACVNNADNNGIIVNNGANFLENTNNVKGTVNQTIRANQWHLISNPILPFDFMNAFLGVYVYAYNENSTSSDNAWINILSGLMATDKGYLVKNINTNKTIQFKGILNSGEMMYPLAYTSALNAQAGYNMVGNPYPCAIDWANDAGFDKSNITGAIYIWDDNTKQYGVSNGTVATAPMTSNIIPACQGFFVKAVSPTFFKINNLAKTLNTERTFYKSDEQIENLIRIRLTGENRFDETIVYFDDDATENYDLTKDADKLLEAVTNLYTFSDNNYPLAINVTENKNQSIPMFFTSDVSGNYTLLVNEYNFTTDDIYLEDVEKKSVTKLNLNSEYSFYYSNTTTRNFILHFGKINTSIGGNDSKNVFIYATKGIVNILNAENSKVEIVDILGKQILTENILTNNKQIELAHSAIYIVKVTKENKATTQKVFVE